MQTGSGPVHPGLVNFCDANATSCSGAAFLGSAQLTSAGTASLHRTFSIGSHSIKAVFAGTTPALTSASTGQTLTVTGVNPTTTVASSSAGTLSAVVNYQGTVPPASGESISFADTTNNNLNLGTATLGAASALTFSFSTGHSITAGTFSVAMVSGDFNGDGFTDLAVANYLTNDVGILLGDATGNFTAASNSPISVGSGPTAIVTNDFDSDGKLDLAVANQNSNTVTILMGDGSGGFQAGSTIPVDNGPQSLVAGDFDRDGIPDIAVANLYASTITVLTGDGSGGFNAAVNSPIAVGGNPISIASADLNHDGNLDLVVANSYDSTVSVLAGDGQGAFTAMSGSPFSVGNHPVALALADFNSDNFVDIATVSDSSKDVTVLLGSGSTFTLFSGTAPATGDGPATIAIGDFNADGKPDLVIPNSNSKSVTILLGDGSGGFTAAPYSPLENFNSPVSVTTADLDADGYADLAVGNLGGGVVNNRLGKAVQTATATLNQVIVPGGGTHSVVAIYSGDSDYAPSTSAAISVQGSTIPTTTTLFVSPGSSVAFQSNVQLTATISPTPDSNYVAGGLVTFFDGSTQIGTASVSNGQAVLSITSLAVGSHSITASYAGDTNFSASSSSASTLTITALTIDLNFSTGTVQTVVHGNSVVYTFNITTPTGSFPAPVTFTVTGLPTGATASFNPTSFPANSAGGIVTMTVQTSATAAWVMPLHLDEILLAILFLPLLGTKKMRGAAAAIGRNLMMLTCVFGILIGLSSCGGSTSSTNTVPTSKSYTLTVTATSGSVQKSTTVTLIVQ